MSAPKKIDREAEKKRLKEEASALFAKGKLEKALESYLHLWKLAPEDPRVRLKIGEILQKLSRPKEAIVVYKKVAESYATNGFLIQAISVCKIILELDPKELETKNLLAGLYAKRGMEKDSRLVSGSSPARTEEASAESLLDELFSEDAGAERNLPTIPLFSELRKEEMLALIDRLTPWRMPGGTAICQQGQASESMFIIAGGRVRVETQTSAGPVPLAMLEPGDFFGEMGLFSRQPRSATCIAEEEVDLLEIRRDHFEEMLKKFPRVDQVLHDFYRSRVLDTLLARSEVFGVLEPSQRTSLGRLFVPVEVKSGQVLLREGDPGDCLFVIRDGTVEIFTAKNGKEVRLASLGPGDFFGEVALLSNTPRTASCRATATGVMMRLDQKDFSSILAENVALAARAKEYVEKRVRETIKAMT